MNKLKKSFNSFYCAIRGIAFCVRHESHMRIHLVTTVYVLYFATFYDFSPGEYAVLVLTCAVVMALELMNTSVEVLIDKVSPKYNIFAMIGKDIAAGAVFMGALGAAAVGVIMLWNTEVFARIWQYFTTDVVKPIILLISVVLSLIFILSAKKRRTGAQRHKEQEQ